MQQAKNGDPRSNGPQPDGSEAQSPAAGKPAWTAPTVIRLDAKETAAVPAPKPGSNPSVPIPEHFFMGS